MGGGELVDLVDLHDRAVGRATIGRCLDEGLLHRAVAVLVVRGDGKLLLQRRSLKDSWHPGRWTLSSTGHVKAGEAYESAARRELKEELGLVSRIVPVSKTFMPKIRSRGSTEWEVVLFFTSRTDGEVSIDPVELEGVREVGKAQLELMMKGRGLTPDAKILLRQYLYPSPGRPSSRQSR